MALGKNSKTTEKAEKPRRKPGRPKKEKSTSEVPTTSNSDKINISTLISEVTAEADETRWTSKFYDEDKQKAAEEEAKKPEEEKVHLTPSQYFDMVKDEMTKETSESISKIYDVTLELLKKYKITKQKAAARHCYATCMAMTKEIELLKFGIDKWVDRRFIDKFIDEVADECVCIITMEDYPRSIPDEIIEKVGETAHIFDQFFILFTDYTGEKRQEVAKEKRDKDPILFGNIFIDGKVSHKMYFIGDWEDEYCHLTLNQMIDKMAQKYEGDIVTPISDIEASREELKKLIDG
jgi:hypothetical protein